MSERWSDGAGRVRRSRTEHPGSSGGWSGSIVEYDILGRVKRQSVPTEISVPNPNDPETWAPAGDDLTRGWLWTHQKYDWKGRIVRKINTDGIDQTALNDSDVLTTYEGCGCAGGQITTIQSENVPNGQPNTNARRTQKVYADILGRAWKTVAMKWDGTTQYTTTEQTFNGRDQVIKTKQIDNTSTASPQAFQDTITTYDGHGRKKTLHLPEYGSGTFTSWNYNADDTMQSITDPRGMSSVFVYNSRKLPETISYTVPSGSSIPATPPVIFSYDNAGNRTQMSDGFGSTVYNYDSLSRIASESRQFSELGISHTIGYGYTLTGRIKELLDPADASRNISYVYNRAGFLSGITGAGYGGVTNYIQNRKVTADGIVKHEETGNGVHMDVQYNVRGLISNYQITKPAQSEDISKWAYTYSEAGELRQTTDLRNSVPVSNYRYDNVGRLTEASADPVSQVGSPFYYAMNYDAWGNMTNTLSGFWNGAEGSYYATLSNTYDSNSNRNIRAIFNSRGTLVNDSRKLGVKKTWGQRKLGVRPAICAILYHFDCTFAEH